MRNAKSNQYLAERINGFYDRVMYHPLVDEFTGASHFQNYGYWLPGTKSAEEAGENLVRVLLEMVPRSDGPALDVACGLGATTRYLTRYFRPEDVIGINISHRQLETCRTVAPACTFRLMDATWLDFPDNTFDVVVCVEAAFHFDTRADFLTEALRVLRPGGHLILSDILSDLVSVEANRLHGPGDYHALLCDVGFDQVRIVDATRECWEEFLRACRNFLLEKRFTNELDRATFRSISRNLRLRALVTRYYLLIAACKPTARKPAREGGRRW